MLIKETFLQIPNVRNIQKFVDAGPTWLMVDDGSGDLSSTFHDPEERGDLSIKGSLSGVANREGPLGQTLA